MGVGIDFGVGIDVEQEDIGSDGGAGMSWYRREYRGGCRCDCRYEHRYRGGYRC